MDKKTFNKLLKNCKTNSGRKAMTELFDYLFPKIVLHISVRFGNQDLGEDIAQEFFHKLLTLEYTDEIEYPLAWTYKICDNMAKDYFENDSRYRATNEKREDDKTSDPLGKLLILEYVEQIHKMRSPAKEIIIMHIYDGYKLKEIAEILNMNYNTVRQIFSRGIKKLKYL